MGWAHGATGWAKQQPPQQRRRRRPRATGARVRADLQGCAHPVEKLRADNRLVLAGIGCPLVDGITDIPPVGEELVEEALVNEPPTPCANALSNKDVVPVIFEPGPLHAR